MTSTPDFGSGKREGHDAKPFYDRALATPVLSKDTTVNVVPQHRRGMFNISSALASTALPDNSVGLVFTSPPYHVGKEYDTDATFDEYIAMLRAVFKACWHVLEPGGKCVINLANLGRKPYIFLTDIVSQLMIEEGFLARGEIIWVKGEGSNGSCAWGTFGSAKNPVVRDLHEYLLIFSKGTWGRVRKGESTMTPAEFMEATLSVWKIRPEAAKRVGHPAPFPVPLAERVINLFSYADDVILDPFMGSGTTAIAAENLGRYWVGFETDLAYCHLAHDRLRANRKRLASQPDTGQKESP